MDTQIYVTLLEDKTIKREPASMQIVLAADLDPVIEHKRFDNVYEGRDYWCTWLGPVKILWQPFQFEKFVTSAMQQLEEMGREEEICEEADNA